MPHFEATVGVAFVIFFKCPFWPPHLFENMLASTVKTNRNNTCIFNESALSHHWYPPTPQFKNHCWMSDNMNYRNCSNSTEPSFIRYTVQRSVIQMYQAFSERKRKVRLLQLSDALSGNYHKCCDLGSDLK